MSYLEDNLQSRIEWFEERHGRPYPRHQIVERDELREFMRPYLGSPRHGPFAGICEFFDRMYKSQRYQVATGGYQALVHEALGEYGISEDESAVCFGHHMIEASNPQGVCYRMRDILTQWMDIAPENHTDWILAENGHRAVLQCEHLDGIRVFEF